MNQNNNIFNKYDIENKLKDFKEGQDYSIFPTDEPNIKTYNFHNDKLRSMFVGDKVPVKIARETYDDKNYSYRGHFEEGKDYYYSHQTWEGNPPADKDGWRPLSEEMWKSSNGDYTSLSMNFRPFGIKGTIEGRRNPDRTQLEELKWKYNQISDKLISLQRRPESDFGVNGKEKKEHEIAEVKRNIAKIERLIEQEKNNTNGYGRPYLVHCECDKMFNKNTDCWGVQDDCGFQPTCCYGCAEKVKSKHGGKIIKSGSDEYFRKNDDLQKENQDLHQQLSEVQKQLAEVLEELKKLKRDFNGKDSEKLEQEIVKSERLVKDGEKVSVSEVQEQVNKSQALMKEFKSNVVATKDNKGGNGSLPYVIGGSVILASAGIIGYLLLKKNKGKKVA